MTDNVVEKESANLINSLAKEYLEKQVTKIEIMKDVMERVEKLKLNDKSKEKIGEIKEAIFKKVTDYFLKKFNLDMDTLSLLGDIAKLVCLASKGKLDINSAIDITVEMAPKVGKCCCSIFSCCCGDPKVEEPVEMKKKEADPVVPTNTPITPSV